MTARVRYPDIFAATITLLGTLPGGFTVYDSQPVTNDNPTNYVTVGYVSDDSAGSFAQVWDPGGYGTVESGSIKCHIVSNAGDYDPTITRNTTFAFFQAWQAALAKDPTLGGVLEANSVLDLSAEVMSVQNELGSASSLLVTLSYQTTTYF